MEEIIAKYEKIIIAQALKKNNHNKTKTAKALDVARKTLAKKITQYKLNQ